jgi:hypothetical protein
MSAKLRRAHTLQCQVRNCCDDDRKSESNDKLKGLSVSAIRGRYQTTLRCFTLTGEVLSGQGVREDGILSGEYTGAECK